MYELSPHIERWIEQSKTVCLATVINTWGSSPRPVGTKMAFTADHLIAGSVSAGCVEGAIIEAGIHTLNTDRPQVLHYSVTDETAFNVGLSCGGKIDIFVRKLDEPLFRELAHHISARDPIVLLTIIEESSELFGKEIVVAAKKIVFGTLGKGLDDQALKLAGDTLTGWQSQIANLEIPGKASLQVFVDVINPPPVLVIVGGVHIAIILAVLAKAMGFFIIVVDPRKAFSSPERFPQVDQLIQEWPQDAFRKIPLNANTSIAILTHDPKIDDEALKIVLNSPAPYIGILGSRRTHAKRCERLLADGITPQQLERIHAPIGLNLGGKTPQEIALAVLAEIVAVRNGRNLT